MKIYQILTSQYNTISKKEIPTNVNTFLKQCTKLEQIIKVLEDVNFNSKKLKESIERLQQHIDELSPEQRRTLYNDAEFMKKYQTLLKHYETFYSSDELIAQKENPENIETLLGQCADLELRVKKE